VFLRPHFSRRERARRTPRASRRTGREGGREGGGVREREEGSVYGSEEVRRSLGIFPTPFFEDGEGEENTEGLKEEGEGGREGW